MSDKPKFVNGSEGDILCPQCNPPRKLVVRTVRKTGHQFLGCPNWPECDYTREIPDEWVLRAQGQAELFDTGIGNLKTGKQQ